MLVREIWKIPFLRLLIPLALGILAANYFQVGQFVFLALFLLFSTLSFVYKPFLDRQSSFHLRWIFGAIVNLLLFTTGFYITLSGGKYEPEIMQSQMVMGIINNTPRNNANSIKVEIKVQQYLKANIWHSNNEKLLVSFQPDSLSSNLEYGDLVLIKGKLKEISNAGNPSEFDYKKYLARKHIHFKSFQMSKEWLLLDKNRGRTIYSTAYKLRNRLLKLYRDKGIDGEEFGLLAALTLGATDYLNDELIEAYADSGAMHILSVSGLHVGIILLVLEQLLFFMQKKPYLRVLKAVLIILSIWFFALLTGLSPSVNRASIMISLFILAGLSNKKPSPYNSIAASAFILLLVDPFYIFDVGFQLSYLAVISLLFFYHRIYRCYMPKYYLVNKIWSLTVVSVSAQIGTTALSIFYFHQFPVYAVVSNLIAVPLSSVIMILAIALLSTSFIAPIAKVMAIVLDHSITTLNSATRFIDKLPFATVEPVSLSGTETIFIHAALALVLIFIVTKNNRIFIAILSCILITFVSRDLRYLNEKQTKTFTVYNFAQKSAFSFIDQGKLKLYADSMMFSNPKSISYLTSNILANGFIKCLSKQQVESPIKIKGKPVAEEMLKYLVCMDSLRVIYLNGDYRNYNSTKKLHIDYIVLSKNTQMNLRDLINLFQFDLLIVDSSVPKWKQVEIKKDCQQLTIPFYFVSESGAFVYKIQPESFFWNQPVP